MCRERERGARRDAGPASGRDARTRHDVVARSARARPLRHQGLSDRRHQSPCLVCRTDRLSAGVASLSVPLDSAFGAFLLLGVIVASAQTRSVRLRTSAFCRERDQGLSGRGLAGSGRPGTACIDDHQRLQGPLPGRRQQCRPVQPAAGPPTTAQLFVDVHVIIKID